MTLVRECATVALLAATLATGRGAPAPATDAPPAAARALIARVVDAYGGRAALQRVHAYRIEGTLFSSLRHTDSPTVREFERPGRLRVRIDYANGSELRVVDGARGWRNEGGGPVVPAHGPMLDAMVLQAARAAVPWILMERAVAPTDVDGVSAPGVEIPLGDGLALRAWVDPATHRVLLSQGTLDHGGMRTHFETKYGDFHRVNGVWFAYDEENWASGAPTGHTSITRVTLNPELPAGTFAPSGRAAPGRHGGS